MAGTPIGERKRRRSSNGLWAERRRPPFLRTALCPGHDDAERQRANAPLMELWAIPVKSELSYIKRKTKSLGRAGWPRWVSRERSGRAFGNGAARGRTHVVGKYCGRNTILTAAQPQPGGRTQAGMGRPRSRPRGPGCGPAVFFFARRGSGPSGTAGPEGHPRLSAPTASSRLVRRPTSASPIVFLNGDCIFLQISVELAPHARKQRG